MKEDREKLSNGYSMRKWRAMDGCPIFFRSGFHGMRKKKKERRWGVWSCAKGVGLNEDAGWGWKGEAGPCTWGQHVGPSPATEKEKEKEEKGAAGCLRVGPGLAKEKKERKRATRGAIRRRAKVVGPELGPGLGLIFFSSFLSWSNASLQYYLLFFLSFSNSYKMNKTNIKNSIN